MAKFIEDSNCFDDEIDGLSKAIDAYNKVRIINNPYTGNKKKMLITIYSSLIKNNIKTDTFLDLFSGSSVVGLFFNILGSEVDSNDLLSFPFITSVSFLENKNVYFTKNEINHLFSSNNSIEGFIFNNYTELSENRKFTKKEAVWLDSFRQKLSEMYGFIDEKITQSTAKNGFQRDSDFYKSCMGMTYVINYVLSQCHIGGRLNKGQVLADSDFRLKRNSHIDYNGEMTFSDLFIPNFNFDKEKKCCSYKTDAIELLANNNKKYDCIYIDPPYGGSQSDYSFMYKFCEEFIMNKKIEDIEYIKNARNFNNSNEYEKHFNSLLFSLPMDSSWVFSYNDSSWLDVNGICSFIEKFKNKIIIEEIDYNYQYRKNSKSRGKEYLIIAK